MRPLSSSLLRFFSSLTFLLSPVFIAESANAVTAAEAAYHVIYSYPDLTIPSQLKSLVSAGKVGGIILFGENVDSSLASKIADLQKLYSQSSAYAGKPLLILTDQEGGQVKRLPGSPTLSEKDIGASSSRSTAATTTSKQAAAALAAYHNNGNLAPVADVFRFPG